MNKKTFLTAALIAATAMGINAQVGINTDSPTATLDIIQMDKATNPGHGFRLDDGNQAAGKILTSDTDGVGTWEYNLGTETEVKMRMKSMRLDTIVTYQDILIADSVKTITGSDFGIRFINDSVLFVPQGRYMVAISFDLPNCEIARFTIWDYYNLPARPSDGTSPSGLFTSVYHEWLNCITFFNFASDQEMVFGANLRYFSYLRACAATGTPTLYNLLSYYNPSVRKIVAVLTLKFYKLG
jgi:hypothetical protein